VQEILIKKEEEVYHSKIEVTLCLVEMKSVRQVRRGKTMKAFFVHEGKGHIGLKERYQPCADA
jgi:hypothetical protein